MRRPQERTQRLGAVCVHWEDDVLVPESEVRGNEAKWVLKDDYEFSRKGGDWGLAPEAEQRAHTKARNWKRAP